ncbi:MAG: hypothetical protein H0X66_01830 [Verrucomicrobia bacterium]|nr:hypothetical protein [Verrucomicrobiota bacterium]
MNHEQQLQLQAYLDGELSDRESRKVTDLLASNEEARNLFSELQFTRTALVENEPEFKLPESREFFWSKIQREIRQTEAAPVPTAAGVSVFAWLQRYLMPVSVVAVLAVIGIFAMSKSQPTQTAYAFGEIEALNGDMDSITFRSEAERMTVIYLYDNKPEVGAEVTSDSSI